MGDSTIDLAFVLVDVASNVTIFEEDSQNYSDHMPIVVKIIGKMTVRL